MGADLIASGALCELGRKMWVRGRVECGGGEWVAENGWKLAVTPAGGYLSEAIIAAGGAAAVLAVLRAYLGYTSRFSGSGLLA